MANHIIMHEDHAEVMLTGKYGGSVKIDLCDVERISKHTWASKVGKAAQAKISGKVVTMPRVILEAKEGEMVVTNRIRPMDYRRENLLLIRG